MALETKNNLVLFSFFLLFIICKINTFEEIQLKRRTVTEGRRNRRNIESFSSGLFLVQKKNSKEDIKQIFGKNEKDFQVIQKNTYLTHLGKDDLERIKTKLDVVDQLSYFEKFESHDKTFLKVTEEWYSIGGTVELSVSVFRDFSEEELVTIREIEGIDQITAKPNKFIEVRMSSNYETVLESLKSNENVVWINRKTKLAFKNYAASKIMTGVKNEQDETVPRFWKNGIKGEGQIVGVADSGLDHSNCLFYDETLAVTLNSVMTNHRSLYYYQTLTSSIGDDSGGHGTHVSGSVIGSTAGSNAGICTRSSC